MIEPIRHMGEGVGRYLRPARRLQADRDTRSRGGAAKLAVGLMAGALMAGCGSTVQTDGLQPGAAVVPGTFTDALGTPTGEVPLGAPVDSLGSPQTASDPSAPGLDPVPAPTGTTALPPGSPTGTADPTDEGQQTPTATPPVQAGPISVGYLVVKDVGAATAALGYGGLSTGDGATQAEAAIKLVNDSGGVGGREIEPVIFELDAAQDLPSQYAAACSTFFEDNAVSAVVAVYSDDVVRACASQRGVPYVDANISAPASTFSQFSNVLQPTMPTTEQGAEAMVDGLARIGWFKPTSVTEIVKVGLLTHDTAAWEKVSGVVSARLKAAGVELASTFEMPESDIGRATTAGQAAVLRFRSAGVNRVLAVDKGGFALSWFAIAANLQGYYPKIGMSTLSKPVLEPLVLSPRALAGSAGVGGSPIFDTPPKLQPATSSRTGKCLAAMSAARQDMTVPGARQGGLVSCEATFLLADAWSTGATTLTAFLQGAKALGKRYQAVSAFATDFTSSRAGAAAYRPIAYDSGCNCFKYSGATVSFS